jgi:hypothetical protein
MGGKARSGTVRVRSLTLFAALVYCPSTHVPLNPSRPPPHHHHALSCTPAVPLLQCHKALLHPDPLWYTPSCSTCFGSATNGAPDLGLLAPLPPPHHIHTHTYGRVSLPCQCTPCAVVQLTHPPQGLHVDGTVCSVLPTAPLFPLSCLLESTSPSRLPTPRLGRRLICGTSSAAPRATSAAVPRCSVPNLNK